MNQARPRQGANHHTGARGELFHATPYTEGFPYDDWTHLSTREAAEHYAATIRPETYGLPAGQPVTIHTVRLEGRVYPQVLTHEQADEVWGAGHVDGLPEDGLPDGNGYQIFPYRDDAAPGDFSYLVQRSAIVLVRSEVARRNERRGALAPDAPGGIPDRGGPAAPGLTAGQEFVGPAGAPLPAGRGQRPADAAPSPGRRARPGRRQ